MVALEVSRLWVILVTMKPGLITRVSLNKKVSNTIQHCEHSTSHTHQTSFSEYSRSHQMEEVGQMPT